MSGTGGRPPTASPAALFAVAMAIMLAACAGGRPTPGSAAAAPVFSPQAFFTGATVGDGVLRVGFARARPVHVASNGHVEPDGTLVLAQRIEQTGRPLRSRIWRLRPVGDGDFAGTLSDASGPVRAEARGNTLHIRFTAKGGVHVEQWLVLQGGGEVALNRMVFRKLGMPVATLRETIRRQP